MKGVCINFRNGCKDALDGIRILSFLVLQKFSNQPYLCYLFGVLYPETIRIHKIPNEENFICKNHEFNEPSTHEPWFWSKSKNEYSRKESHVSNFHETSRIIPRLPSSRLSQTWIIKLCFAILSHIISALRFCTTLTIITTYRPHPKFAWQLARLGGRECPRFGNLV